MAAKRPCLRCSSSFPQTQTCQPDPAPFGRAGDLESSSLFRSYFFPTFLYY